MIHKKSGFFIMLAACIALAGCDLTTVPEDSMTPERYFKSAASLEQWLNNCYTMFSSVSLVTTDADDAMDNSTTALFGRTRQPATETWSWTTLRRINYFLENSHYCSDEQAVAYYNGEARFFRALFYWQMVRKYGDIMWYDQVIGSTDKDLLYKARDERGYVVDKMIEDLDAAAQVLVSEKNASSSAVNRWVALGLKARVCLFEGTFRKYHGLDDWEHFLEECVSACETIMNEGGYSLYNEGEHPYQDLFCQDPAPSCETILARVYNNNLSLYHSLPKDMIGAHRGLTQRFVNHYLMSDGSYFSSQEGYQTRTFAEVFENRDPRMRQTVWGPGCTDYTGNTLGEAFNLTSLTGYFPLKWMIDVTDVSNRGDDIILMRYAEILLSYAEAKAELGTLSQDDLDKTVKLVRERAGMQGLDMNKANSSPDPLLVQYYPQVSAVNSSNVGVILEIRRERTVELVCEGHREWDILRWKEGASIDNEKNPFYGVYIPAPGKYDFDGDGKYDFELYTDTRSSDTSGNSDSFKSYKIGVEVYLSGDNSGNIVAFKGNKYTWNEERDYLWPIPAAQRALCGGILTQNPGWVDGLDF